MYAKFLKTVSTGQELLCTLRIVDGKLQFDKEVPPKFREGLELLRSRYPEDEKFFEMIPREYSGSYLRGMVVRD